MMGSSDKPVLFMPLLTALLMASLVKSYHKNIFISMIGMAATAMNASDSWICAHGPVHAGRGAERFPLLVPEPDEGSDLANRSWFSHPPNAKLLTLKSTEFLGLGGVKKGALCIKKVTGNTKVGYSVCSCYYDGQNLTYPNNTIELLCSDPNKSTTYAHPHLSVCYDNTGNYTQS